MIPRKAAAMRIRTAKEKGMALVRRMEKLDELSVDEMTALGEAFEALLVEYPDVYTDPPVPLEILREHMAGLRKAEDDVRQAKAEEEETSRKLAAAHVALDALAESELGRARAKGEKPS